MVRLFAPARNIKAQAISLIGRALSCAHLARGRFGGLIFRRGTLNFSAHLPRLSRGQLFGAVSGLSGPPLNCRRFHNPFSFCFLFVSILLFLFFD